MVTDSDNRIRLAPVSEGVHRSLWSVLRFQIFQKPGVLSEHVEPLKS
jgi:hypothetical protein